MRHSTLGRLIATDVDRYRYLYELDGEGRAVARSAWLSGLRCLVLCPGLQASVVHRIGHALWTWQPASAVGRIVRVALRIGHLMATRVVEVATGISIANGARIGSGLYIGHFGGVIIGIAQLGDNCTISHGVTIGRSGRVGERGRPTCGDRVWVGPGAVLVGPIVLGSDSVVGANAVVTRDVPARASALGIPARLHRRGGSFELVAFRGAAADDGRRASLSSAGTDVAGPAIAAS